MGKNKRKSILTGEILDKHNMIRFTISPDNIIIPDIFEKLNGRGCWLESDEISLNEAINKKKFNYALKCKKAEILGNISQIIRKMLAKNIHNTLALANKAGMLLYGFEKVENALKSRKAFLFLQVSGAGSDREKLQKISNYLQIENLVLPFKREEISSVMGRENIVNMAICSPIFAKKIKVEINRLNGFN